MMLRILLILLVFSVNCYANFPDWYNNKPEDNKLYIYSVGHAEDNSDAIFNALNNIVKIDEEYSDNIHINFSNYTIENQEEIDGVHYVLVSVKRNELFSLQLENLKTINNTIEEKYKNLSKNVFERDKEIKEIYELIDYAKFKIEVIKKINKFDEKKLLEKYDKILKDLKKYNISLSLIIEDENLSKFEEDFKKAINDNNILLDNNSKVKLILNINTDKKKIQNSFFVNNKLVMMVIDDSKVIRYNYKNYISNNDKGFIYAFNENMNNIYNDFNNTFLDLIENI